MIADWSGDTLIYTGKGQAAVDIHQNHLRGFYNLGYNNKTGQVSMFPVEGANMFEMTDEQQEYANYLDIVVNGKGTTSINVVENSTSVFIGNWDEKAIDIGDIYRIPLEQKSVNQRGVIMHEVWEQYLGQNSKIDYGVAHKAATLTEACVTLKGLSLSNARGFDNYGYVNIYTSNGVVRIKGVNNNIKAIYYQYDKNNVYPLLQFAVYMYY